MDKSQAWFELNLFHYLVVKEKRGAVFCFQLSFDLISHIFRYDVLILHAAEDSEFTQLMVHELENQKISVCLRDRDLVGKPVSGIEI